MSAVRGMSVGDRGALAMHISLVAAAADDPHEQPGRGQRGHQHDHREGGAGRPLVAGAVEEAGDGLAGTGTVFGPPSSIGRGEDADAGQEDQAAAGDDAVPRQRQDHPAEAA